MNKIIKLVLRYQTYRKNFDFEKIVNEVDIKIKYYCKKMPCYYREDIRQELLIDLYQAICNFRIIKYVAPNDIFNYENNLSKNYQKENYLLKFIQKDGKELFASACKQKEIRDKFNYEYSLYCNEKQFNFYINQRFNFTVKNFFNRYISKDEEIISLNSITSDTQELIDEIADVDGSNIIAFDKFNISVNDEEFLKRFIQKGRLLTEMEVAKELGISQQAVHKRKKRIIEKYRNKKKIKNF